MTEHIVGKNYLLGTKIAFLIISFVIAVFGMMVQNDIWPILQTSIPSQEHHSAWVWLAMIIGLILPAAWLIIDWSETQLRYGLLSLLAMLVLQLVTEFFVAKYFFVSMIIPTSILYVGYRLIQLINLQRLLLRTKFKLSRSRGIRISVIAASLCFWIVLWVNVTFVVFPQVINQFF